MSIIEELGGLGRDEWWIEDRETKTSERSTYLHEKVEPSRIRRPPLRPHPALAAKQGLDRNAQLSGNRMLD